MARTAHSRASVQHPHPSSFLFAVATICSIVVPSLLVAVIASFLQNVHIPLLCTLSPATSCHSPPCFSRFPSHAPHPLLSDLACHTLVPSYLLRSSPLWSLRLTRCKKCPKNRIWTSGFQFIRFVFGCAASGFPPLRSLHCGQLWHGQCHTRVELERWGLPMGGVG